MAILSKIREKTIVLIVIIALALFAFVVGDAIKGGGASKVNEIGTIDGEVISREDFSKRLETYKARVGRKISDVQAMNAVWDGIVRERVYKKQLEEAGIVVGEDDVWQAIVNMRYFQNDPSFKNEAGLFDEEKVKEFIANMKDEAEGAAKGSREKNIWLNWLGTEQSIKQNLIRNAYDNLVSSGLGASLAEGKRDYALDKAKVTASYVYVPYTSIADSLVKISTSDYKDYINQYANQYKVDNSRSLKLVKFEFKASEADKKVIKESLISAVENMRKEEKVFDYISQMDSDLPTNKNFMFKNELPKGVFSNTDEVKVGSVFGPYEDKGYYKVSKVVATKKMTDSVKSRHIIVPYVGAFRASATVTKTKEAAKKTADSIFKLVKNSTSKFIEIADKVNTDGTKGKGGEIGWVAKKSAFSPNFDLDFANFLFDNKKGAIQVVETKFGFHIIKIDDQKDYKQAYQLATLARQIVPSEETEGKFYQDAEIFASELSKGKNFDELAKEKNYRPLMANKIKELSENIPSLKGNQRQIVRWAFADDTDVNTVKRFDIDNGYVVATVYAKTKKGLATVADVAGSIRPILMKKKKAVMIRKKMEAASLEEIAKQNGAGVRKALNVTLASPTISGVGKEPNVVGAMMGAKKGEVIKGIEGVRGVFAIKVISKEQPTELDNYSSFRKRLANKVKAKSAKLYNALKEATEIEDYRANIY